MTNLIQLNVSVFNFCCVPQSPVYMYMHSVLLIIQDLQRVSSVLGLGMRALETMWNWWMITKPMSVPSTKMEPPPHKYSVILGTVWPPCKYNHNLMDLQKSCLNISNKTWGLKGLTLHFHSQIYTLPITI